MARNKHVRGRPSRGGPSRRQDRRDARPPPPPKDAAWSQGAPPGARDEFHRARSPPRISERRDRREQELYSRNDDVYQFRGNSRMDDYREDQQDRGQYRNERFDNHAYAGDHYRPRLRSPPRHGPSGYGQQRRADQQYDAKQDQRGFDFSYDAPASIAQGLRDSNAQAQQMPQRNDRQNGRGRGAYRGRGGYQQTSRKAADRAFLKDNRAPTPELMPGMDMDDRLTTKFRDINNISDSEEEEDVDISHDDVVDIDDAELPRKKHAPINGMKAADGDSVPRWSNPDPYTALPPPDASDRKKKDVVKLIRKARVAADAENAAKSVAEAADFISFNFDDDNDAEPSDEIVEEGEVRSVDLDSRARDNPIGLRPELHHPTPSYSHKDVFHQTLPQVGPPKPVTIPIRPEVIVEVSSDPALGSRKRTHDDEIKGPPRFVKKKVVTAPASGKILKEWKPRGNSTPWAVFDHAETESMGNWLHKEILDFYSHVRPRDFEDKVRDELLDSIGSAVSERWSDARICPFGSYVAGLYLPTADMDVVFVSERFMNGGPGHYDTNQHLKSLRTFLQRKNIAENDSVECIFGAKVPIVKYVDRLTGLRVDVSFENDTGLVANRTFKQWKDTYPAMPILVTLIKQFLTMRGLNEPVNGGIGGFSAICLVTSLLQLMPQVQSRNMIPEHHLGEILMEFLDLYGNQFNTMTTGIQMNPPRYLPKSKIKNMVYKLQDREPRFAIVDPNNSGNDIAGGAKNTATIQKAFSDAFNALQTRMKELEALPIEERRGQSILGVILGGDYSSFDLQREHLRYLDSLRH